MKKNYLISLVVAVVSMSPLPVFAQQSGALTPEQQKRSDALVKEAVESYSERRYEEAIELFKQAYEIQQEPELLYNIARSYERLSDNENAVEWYQRFLDVPGTTGELRTRARDNIAALRREIDAMKAAADKAEHETADDQKESAEGADAKVEAVPSSDTVSQQDKTASNTQKNKKSRRPLRIAGWSAAGVGAAALVTGGIFGGLALSAKNDYDAAKYNEERITYRDDTERDALIFDITFFSGAGLAAAGIALLVVDAIQHRSKVETVEVDQKREKIAAQRHKFTVTPSFLVGNGSLTGGLVGHF